MAYDNTCKFLAQTFPRDISSWLLGRAIALTQLEPTELIVEPIHADTLVLLQSPDLILHAEFQVEPDPEMPFRMLDYWTRARRRYPSKQMRQSVIYLRETRSPRVFRTTFESETTRHEYGVIRMWEQPSERFLQSPGLLPFAVLARTSDRARTLREVAARIEEIGDRRQKSSVTTSAGVLAGLLLKEEVIESILREDVMKESVIYQKIASTAEQRGEYLANRRVVLNCLRLGLPIEQIAQITGFSIEEVQQIASESTQS